MWRAVGLLALGAGLPHASPVRAQATDLPSMVRSIKPSIVAIGTFQRLRSPAFAFHGTGFAVVEGNLIATCAHVVPAIDPAQREVLAVAIPGAESTRIVEAKVLRLNRDADLALLQIDGPPVPTLPLATASLPPEGLEIVLIGFPIGTALGLYPATHRGLVAAIAPMVLPAGSSSQLNANNVQRLRGPPIDILQLDATAYPGNSGSPVIDSRTGNVVGIVNMVAVKGSRETAISSPTGISYAVPAKYIQALLSTK